MIVVGTAGWSLPRAARDAFPAAGSHLERYAQVLRGAEINSSFYRAHAPRTYARWAAATPPGFRFSVKLPRTITHIGRLRRARRPLEQFLGEVASLGQRLGPLLIQLPPSLEYEPRTARVFLGLLRERHAGDIALEPRHASWFTARAEALLVAYRVARVAADPAVLPAAAVPGGWPGMVYYRLHGAPVRYWSVYPQDRIDQWADEIHRLPQGTKIWCVFDNTAGGGATSNALQMVERLATPRRRSA